MLLVIVSYNIEICLSFYKNLISLVLVLVLNFVVPKFFLYILP